MLAQDIEAALDLLGGPKDDPVVDFLVDPGAACRALDALGDGGGLVLRAFPEPGKAAPGYGPAPLDPVWVRVMRGAREIGTAQFRGGDGMVRKVLRVELEESSEVCCDAPTCERRRVHASVWIALASLSGGADERLLVAEERVPEGDPEVARGVAARLSKAMEVPCERDGKAIDLAPGEAVDAIGPSLPAAELARVTVLSEGERLVIRDWDSLGPRAGVARNTGVGVALLLAATAAWLAMARAVGGALSGGGTGAAVGAGMAALLLTFGGVTFLAVARHAAQYRARSAPLLMVARDRAAVLPWVARDGAVDVRPEGRLGAAIPLVEVRGASHDGAAVRLETDLGPFDVIVCETEEAARLWRAVLERALDDMRHPHVGSTAKQRARARAA